MDTDNLTVKLQKLKVGAGIMAESWDAWDVEELKAILQRVEEGMTTVADAEVLRQALGLVGKIPDNAISPEKRVQNDVLAQNDCS